MGITKLTIMQAIAAMDLNRGIGYKGTLPWVNKDDLKFFRDTTWNKNLIMGHDTFKSVGTLKNRFIYVLTSNQNLLANKPFSKYQYINMETLRKKMKDPIWNATTFVCGGTKTYQSLLSHIDTFYLTIMLNEYNVDSYLPEFEGFYHNQEIIREHRDYWIVKYWKD